MRIFCLMWVESSLVGSVQTESLRMSPLTSDRCIYFTIKSSRIIDSFTFIDFFQPWLFRGDFSFSWPYMTLYYASFLGGNINKLFAQRWMCICVCLQLLCTLVYRFCVRIRLLRTSVYIFCAHCKAFAYVYGLSFAQVVQILRTYTDFVRVEWLLRTYTAYLLHILCIFCVYIWLIFTIFNADSIKGSDLAGYSISFVFANAHDSWTVSRIWSWGFRQFICLRELLIIVG